MTNDLGQRYDDIYSKKGFEYGLGKPNKVVTDITRYKSSGEALDVGAGMGRNSLYLASKGFNVTAIDLSEVGLNNLKRSLQEKGLSAKTMVDDITKINFDRHYDVIVSSFVLFHLPPTEAIAFIKKVQEHTAVEGLNAISTFTKDSDFYRNEPNADEYYPEAGELKNLYAGWEILTYEEAKVKAGDKRPGKAGATVINTAATILARKLK